MSDKTENQTSDLADAHGGADNANIGKIKKTDDLCMKRQLEPTDEETSDSISSGRIDVTSSDSSEVEHGKELNVCHHVKTEDEVPINAATGADNANIRKIKITDYLCMKRQLGSTDEETSDSISSGHTDVTSSDSSEVEHGKELNVCHHVKTEDEVPINAATGADNANKGKIKKTDDLCMKYQLGPTDEETSDSISSGRTDVTSSDCSEVKHGKELNVCHKVKTEDEVPINAATGANIGKIKKTDDLFMKRQLGPTDEDTSDSISSGCTDVTSSDGSAVEHGKELNVCHHVKTEDEVPINAATGRFTNCSADATFSLQNQRSHMGNLCSECGKCFTLKSSLIRHQKIHARERERRFLCSGYEQCFTTKSSLIRHQTIHTREKAFLCSDCEKCFSTKPSLIRHQKIHTREKAFLCSDCEKCFTTKSSLNRHQKIHTGEKDFLCSECGKCFPLKSQLISHQKSHRVEKDFLCSECGKRFKFKSALTNHMKIHTGEKDFVCLKCGKCFTHHSTLINHQRTHIKENRSLNSEAQRPTHSRHPLSV
ncbi:zinc finger protein 547-like isoform X1 [Bombina bombina]|uniref:zinc finger protein 547-like isoform X1 n=1 Tax=Bombina bombina TaxID=8345 RepID=UPI00235A5EAD|nr:zinc finger protein 547-like isoform X1 [Bombina bombina]XP_053567486.1 zinc finger protein 547-like isoform X1 [Bombina bombina]XP_053567487.1 zinc finger protein 547-like isoform X1 [Bombina bombina]